MAIKSIYKPEFSRLKKQKLPFTICINSVLQKLKNSDALAVWVHLQSLPENWEIHKTYIMKHFDWGKDKSNNALNYLKECNLLENKQNRDENGTFIESFIVINSGENFKQPSKEFLDKLAEKAERKSKKRSKTNPRAENPSTVTAAGLSGAGLSGAGQTATTKENLLTKVKPNKNTKREEVSGETSPPIGDPSNLYTPPSKPKRKQKKRTPINPDYVPTPEHIRLADELKVDVDLEHKKFIDHCLDNGKTSEDWDAYFRNWLRKAAEYREKNKQGKSTSTKSSNSMINLINRTMGNLNREKNINVSTYSWGANGFLE